MDREIDDVDARVVEVAQDPAQGRNVAVGQDLQRLTSHLSSLAGFSGSGGRQLVAASAKFSLDPAPGASVA